MLTGEQLALAIAAALFAAVGLGALLHWLWSRAGARRGGDAARLAELARQLDEAETARAASEQGFDEAVTEYARAFEQAQADLRDTHAALEEARARIRELEAELARERQGDWPGG